jgi:hypothetical protein
MGQINLRNYGTGGTRLIRVCLALASGPARNPTVGGTVFPLLFYGQIRALAYEDVSKLSRKEGITLNRKQAATQYGTGSGTAGALGQ